MRHFLGWIVLGALFGITTTGCGPNVSRSDLGTIVFEVPTVAGAEEPYRLPDIPPPPPGSSVAERMRMLAPPDSPSGGSDAGQPSESHKK
jgi:hypothetical protein